MALVSGAKLGPYEILSAAGAGGMGEVYRARDTRLDRTVAIKVLPEQFSNNADLKQRFEREARAISSLNHAHICHLYDIGHENGTDYLVMEFIEGESLAQRVSKGALPVEQVVKIGAEIADALDKAHRQGIVHRDLKPGNIMLTKSGAKLLDFGLAKPAAAMKAASGLTGAAITQTSPVSPITQQGHIVGTFQYMSPEQVEGKEADPRSDIFALGAVLYEMATGKRAFEGKSAISVASAILEKEPEPISRVQPLTPPAFEHIVQRCLAKEADERWQSAADVANELKWVSQSSSAAAPIHAKSRRRRPPAAWAAAVALAALIGVGVGLSLRPTPQARMMRTVVLPPDKSTLALLGDFAGPPVISPNGAYIAFTATNADGHPALWVRPIDAAEPHEMPGTQDAIFPFWSPDSRSIGFFADSKLKVTDLNGNSPQVIADTPAGRGGAWGPNGVILFAPDTQNPIMRVNLNGGAPVAVTQIDATKHTSHRWPFFLPDGKHFLFVAINHDQSQSANDAVYYASLDGHEQRMLFHSTANAIYADGYVLYGRDTDLVAQRFDPASGKLEGEPQRVMENVADDLSTWHVDASASNTGVLVFASGGSADLELVWFDRSGKQVGVAASELTNLQDARLSPQGDRIALRVDIGVNDIWVVDLVRGVRTRLTFGGIFNSSPVWSPDGKSIIYATQREQNRDGGMDIMRCNADGSGKPEVVVSGEGGKWLWPFDWSRDGKYLLYANATRSGAAKEEIWAKPLDGGKPFIIVTTTTSYGAGYGIRNNNLSPDGHWLAYSSNEGGQGLDDIFVVPFGGGQGKWQISQGGGSFPAWSSDGKELFYLVGNILKVVGVTEHDGTIGFGVPQTLFTNGNSQLPLFDVAPGAQKFLAPRIVQQTNQPMTVVTNWTAEMKK